MAEIEKKTLETKTISSNPKKERESATERNNKFIAQYRKKLSQINPQLPETDVSDQVNVALRDPVYGQATATGLAMGNNILNTWIKAKNAENAQKAKELEQERWLKQSQDLADEIDYRRGKDEEGKEVIVDADPYTLDAFKDVSVRSNPENQKFLDLLNTPRKAKNAEEAARIRNEQRIARQMLDAVQESLPMQITNRNKGFGVESTGGFFNRMTDALNLVPYVRNAALGGSERAESDARMAMRRAGQKSFARVSPEDLMQEAEENIRLRNIKTAAQQRKIAEIMRLYLQQNPKGVAKQSPDGTVIVLASPNAEAITITPESVDRYAKQFGVGITSR